MGAIIVGHEESVARAARAWAALKAGDIEGAADQAGRWVPLEEGAPAPDVDLCLAQAHIALAEEAYPAALDASIAVLSALGTGVAQVDDATASALARSFQRVICEAGNGAAGLAGMHFAAFSTPDACKRASGVFSGLSTRLYLTRPIATEAKAPLVKHFARCAVACDTALLDLCRKRGGFLDRIRKRREAPVEDASGPGLRPLPELAVEGPLREDAWAQLV